MNSPGVEVRPLAHMLGEAEFNEVFLDGVFIPDADVVGEVDGGWKVAMGTLAFERVAIATGRVNTTGAVNDLIHQIAARTADDGTPLGAQPLVRQRVADLYGRALVHYLIGQRVITGAAPATDRRARSRRSGSCTFARWSRTSPTSGLELDDMGGQFALAEKSAADAEPNSQQRWLRLAYQARGTAIAGGSTFIQRNIVAERILGMPRD